MNSKCNYCINKEQCKECDKKWKDKFIPSDEVKQYFCKGYVGVMGINGSVYTFDTTNPLLVPTHSILIDGDYYCPYCGERMYSIQDEKTLATIDYCCLCQGARDEIEYENKRKELIQRHEQELSTLETEYQDKLLFCSNKLLEIKQRQERKYFEFFAHKHSHFSTLNGKSYTEVEQIIKY